jgi:hypothetical protein
VGHDQLPCDGDLFRRTAVHSSGLRMGRIEVIVHQQGGGRMAVVRRGRVVRRWYCVSLQGAQLLDGQVIVSAGYGRGRPTLEEYEAGQEAESAGRRRRHQSSAVGAPP